MSAATSITVRMPLTIMRRPGRKTVVTPVPVRGEAAFHTRSDPALVKALARAFRYQRLLDEGRYASISEMAAAERIDRGYLGRILHPTLLAPDIVEGVLDGRQPAELELPTLVEPFALGWDVQRTASPGPPSCRFRAGRCAGAASPARASTRDATDRTQAPARARRPVQRGETT